MNNNIIKGTTFKLYTGMEQKQTKTSAELLTFLVFDANNDWVIQENEALNFKKKYKDGISDKELDYIYKSKTNCAQVSLSLHKDICAKKNILSIEIPTTDPKIETDIENINCYNVTTILSTYQNLEENTSQTSLIYDIMDEHLLDEKIKQKCITKIINSLKELAEIKGQTNVINLLKDVNGELSDEFGYFMEGGVERLDRIINFCIEQINYSDVTSVMLPENSFNFNGKIDKPFNQSIQGDCTFIASIKALSNKPKGLKILENSIKKNDDGSVDIHLQGVDKIYTISKLDIKTYMGDFIQFNGDPDVCAILIAINRYLSEYKGNNINGSCAMNAHNILVKNDFTDKQINLQINSMFKNHNNGLRITDKDIDNFNNENLYIVASRSPKSLNIIGKLIEDFFSPSFSYTDSDGNKQNLISQHAYSVIGSDKNNVFIVNPWDTETTIHIPRETFKEFFNCVEICPL